MKLAIPKERRDGEARIAATPETVKKLKALGLDVVVETNAGALARFSDAEFFYEKYSHLSLEDLARILSGVGFHAKLGSMWDKTVRVRDLVSNGCNLLDGRAQPVLEIWPGA